MVNLRSCLTVGLLLSGLHLAGTQADAQGTGRFDLTGPKIDVRVTRAGVMLPIASVPNLEPGDELWLHPDLPPTQSVHYLLIAVFLRGTTNPPPDDWFTKVQTWDRRVREEGVTIKVPADAEQAVLFLAPETGGDFSTLRSAVKGRPGIFVRASQDLAEAGFEQARIEKYLEEIKQVPPGDSVALAEHSNLLARTLALKPNPDCYKRPVDLQYSCLTQTGSQSLLDDGHGQTIAQALSNGPSSDLINQASYTQAAGAGVYSAYVGAIVDLIRLTSTLHVAQYQYIPAVAFPVKDQLNLRLNTPPSFHNPKSVIVIGLPTVQAATPPPLRPAEPDHISCLLDPRMALPIEGAPLVFSTALAHDLTLHLNLPAGTAPQPDIPLLADAYQGGLVFAPAPSPRHELADPAHEPDVPRPVANPLAPKPSAKQAATKPLSPAPVIAGAPITGTIHGMWGFDAFTGPTLPLQHDPGTGWHIVTPAGTPENMIVGKPNHLRLTSTGTACIRTIMLEPTDGQEEARLDWKLVGDNTPSATDLAARKPEAAGAKIAVKSGPSEPSEPVERARSAAALDVLKPAANPTLPTVHPVDITVNLQHAATPGSIRLAILQYGKPDPDQLGTKTFAEPARIEALHLHAGDQTASLLGASLAQVKSVTIKDWTFTPIKPKLAGDDDTTVLTTPEPPLLLALTGENKPFNLKVNEKLTAQVHLEDGRTVEVTAAVMPPRPGLTMLSRRITQAAPTQIQALPTAAQAAPTPIQMDAPKDLPLGAQLTFFLKSKTNYPRGEQLEIASLDGALHTQLSVAANTLVLEDSRTVLATFDPLKLFGASTFGPFRLRAVSPDGTLGEWMPLATIVRLPTLTQLHCPVAITAPCELSGSSLYLIDSVAADPEYLTAQPVPEGYVETTLAIPHPTSATFYLKLRDDPSTIQMVTMPIQIDAPAPGSPRIHTAPGHPTATNPTDSLAALPSTPK